MTIIRGQVVDPRGRPVPEATVFVVSSPAGMVDIGALTDEQGRFSLSARVPGRYTVGVRSERWGTIQEEFEVAGEGTVSVRARFRR